MNSNWLNFKDMLDDIKLYLEQNTGLNIIQNDNPLQLKIGYSCEESGKEWSIRLGDLKKSKDPDSELLLKSLQTEQGKINLLELINSWSNKNLSLHQIGLDCGTDKATYHNYCNLYEAHLSHLRFEPIKLLEIGVFKHQSIMMWRKYFPKAEIHAIDIVDYSNGEKIPNVHYHKINVEDTSLLSGFINKHHDWDVIVDDGGHTMFQQQNAFKNLFGAMKSPGIFIIEDLQTSFENFARSHNPQNDPTTYQMISSLKDKVDFTSPYINLSEYRMCLSQVKSVDIWIKNLNDMNDSMTSIIKK